MVRQKSATAERKINPAQEQHPSSPPYTMAGMLSKLVIGSDGDAVLPDARRTPAQSNNLDRFNFRKADAAKRDANMKARRQSEDSYKAIVRKLSGRDDLTPEETDELTKARAELGQIKKYYKMAGEEDRATAEKQAEEEKAAKAKAQQEDLQVLARSVSLAASDSSVSLSLTATSPAGNAASDGHKPVRSTPAANDDQASAGHVRPLPSPSLCGFEPVSSVLMTVLLGGGLQGYGSEASGPPGRA